jgi:hypothetical protein
MTTSCPPDDRLASLIDGHADATEREALLAHVSACADCYEVFTETARWRDSAEESAPPAAAVASFEPTRRRRAVAPTWLAAAAAVVLALTTAVLMRRPPGPTAGPQVAGDPATPSEVTPTPTIVPVPSKPPAVARPPAWLTAAPWGTRGASQAFADGGDQAVTLGLHGTALARAAGITDADVRRTAVEWIRKSLRARMTIDAKAATRFDAALSGEGIEPFAVAAGEKDRRDLAAFLEAWRIDAVEHRRSALEPRRAAELSRLLAAAGMREALQRLVQELRSQLDGPSPTFEGVGGALADLIEALDS